MPPGNGGDLVNFKAPDGLKSKIPAGKKVIADRIYRDPVCSIRNPKDTPEVRKFKRLELAMKPSMRESSHSRS
jgi:hypothetical protein